MKLAKLRKVWSYGLSVYPNRVKRFLRHLLQLFPTVPQQIPRSEWYDWPVDFLFYLQDLLFCPEIYTTALVITKSELRPVNDLEEYLIQEIYKDTIDSRFILINDHTTSFIKKYAYAFVTYNTIHFDKEISEPIVVHELMHIYQYQKFGSVYLYRCAKAQLSKYNYDYGGVERLSIGLEKGKTIFHYNFEQQAMIVEDYFRRNNQFTMFFDTSANDVYSKYHQDLFEA
jgi:hypothetical protein